MSALSNSQNIAKLLTRIILRVVLLPWNEVKPASGITACELPSSEKLRQSKMIGAALSLLLDVVRKNEQNDHEQSADQAAGTDTRTGRLHDEAERIEHDADDAQHPEHADLRRVIRTAHAEHADNDVKGTGDN